jgi:ribosome-binding factor A
VTAAKVYMKGLRGERLASQFQEEIYAVISTKLRNKYPELSAIKSAKIYISIYDTNNDKKENSFKIIKDNAGFIRHELSQVLHIRTVPELSFILDGSMEYGAKIDKILEHLDIKSEEDENK